MVDNQFKSYWMQPMEDENCSQEFEQVFGSSNSQEDMMFDQMVGELQQIVLDPHFETTLSYFMKNNWAIFDHPTNQHAQAEVFETYRNQLQQFLEKKISQKIQGFQWKQFMQLFSTRRSLVDEQLLDTLLSMQELDNFKAFIKDYRNSYEEEEMLKVLTIKSNKISENKKVKGKDNIFSNEGPLFAKPLQPAKKNQHKEKTEDQLLVPALILTIKPLRKQ